MCRRGHSEKYYTAPHTHAPSFAATFGKLMRPLSEHSSMQPDPTAASAAEMHSNKSMGSSDFPAPYAILRVPFPFRAALAISSDLDDTSAWNDYKALSVFLTTERETKFGRGVGLQFANSIYATAHDGQFSYASATQDERSQLRAMIRAGLIDTLHSYGDLCSDRSPIKAFHNELTADQCAVPIWVDHARAPTNLGFHQTAGTGGAGDLPESRAYHTDLLPDLGTTFCWRGQVSSTFGQDTGPQSIPRLLLGRAWPGRRLLNAKEAAKCALAAVRLDRYSMHRPNDLLRRVRLRDRTDIFEFLRCNPGPRGLPASDDCRLLPDVLSTETVATLISRGGCAALYTHLGRAQPQSPAAIGNFRRIFERLRELQDRELLVTMTTSALLQHSAIRRYAQYRVVVSPERTDILVDAPKGDPVMRRILQHNPAAGISIVIPTRRSFRVLVEGRLVASSCGEYPGLAGHSVVSVPLRRVSADAIASL